MVGYYKIPLYEVDLATIKDYWYIPLISREAAQDELNESFNIINGRGSQEQRFWSGSGKGSSSNKWTLRYGDGGISDGGGSWTPSSPWSNTPSAFTQLKRDSKERFSEKIAFPECVRDELTTDKFNMLRFALDDVSSDYYLKNGKRMSIVKSTDDYGKYSTIHFYQANGVEITNFTVLTGWSHYRDSLRTENLPLLSIAEAINLLGSAEDSNKTCNCGTYSFFYLYDVYDSSATITNQDAFVKRTTVYYKTDSHYPANMTQVRANYPDGWYNFSSLTGVTRPSGTILTTFLGFNGNNTDQNVSILGGDYHEDVEDSENTYPGGGDDKNTYPPDGESGKGTFDNTNDPLDFPSMPLWDATSTGFISMWNPTISEISQLYSFLWDSDVATTLKKLFLEPMDAIISLAFFPVDPTNFPDKRNVTIGHIDTEIRMYAVQKQFVDFDFGTVKLDEYYGAAWDYSPYTKVSIYLPYIGSQELDVDDVMNATLHLQYRIDLLSGMCAAMLKCTRDRDNLDAIIYTWQGNCAMQVPITAGSAREFINSIIQIGAMTGLALVQPAAGAINAVAHVGEEGYSNPSTAGQWVSPAMATYSALNVLGQKVHVQRGGRVDANAGVMSPQSAYLIIDRPISAIPKGWNEYAGYPSLKIKTLSTQKGMTQVAYIKLNGLEATAEEISELDRILKAGVIL